MSFCGMNPNAKIILAQIKNYRKTRNQFHFHLVCKFNDKKEDCVCECEIMLTAPSGHFKNKDNYIIYNINRHENKEHSLTITEYLETYKDDIWCVFKVEEKEMRAMHDLIHKHGVKYNGRIAAKKFSNFMDLKLIAPEMPTFMSECACLSNATEFPDVTLNYGVLQYILKLKEADPLLTSCDEKK